MVHFDSTSFGQVIIDGKKYSDVLIIGDKIEERERERLEQIFGTSHMVAPVEVTKLLQGNPEIVLIGNGQSGALEVSEEVREEIEKSGSKLIILNTPQAIKEYNKFTKEGKKVNALIHTTC